MHVGLSRMVPDPDLSMAKKKVVVSESPELHVDSPKKLKAERTKPENEEKMVKTKSKKDVEQMRERIVKEDKFAAHLMDLMYIPKHRNAENEEDEDEEMDISEDQQRKFMLDKTSRAKTVDELHERLQKKMLELRGNRDVSGKGKKLKAKLSKVEKRKKAKETKKIGKKVLVSHKSGAPNGSMTSSTKSKLKPVQDSNGKLVFSKFDFSDTQDVSNQKKQNVDPKAALQKLKKQKEKIKSLEAIGKTTRVQSLEEKTAWKTALDKAEGVKVKDDESLLKKSIKKKEQRKKSSKKKWDERNAQVEKKKMAKQQKRSENLNKRKDAVKQKKMKKAVKKGRMVPGFR